MKVQPSLSDRSPRRSAIRILRRRWLRIIPVAFIMYTIAYVDRINISLCLPALGRELGNNPVEAGNVAGVFFWGYLVLPDSRRALGARLERETGHQHSAGGMGMLCGRDGFCIDVARNVGGATVARGC